MQEEKSIEMERSCETEEKRKVNKITCNLFHLLHLLLPKHLQLLFLDLRVMEMSYINPCSWKFQIRINEIRRAYIPV